jgi:cobalt transporter subunit CbtB
MNLEMEETLELPRARVPAWTWLVMALAVAAIWALTLENGVVLRAGAETLHELFHDARHLLGVPCH